MGFRALVIEEAVKLSYSGGSIDITFSNGERRKDFLGHLSTIVVGSPRTYVSSYLVSECAKKNIPLIFCDDKYMPIGHAIPLFPVHNCARTVKKQTNWGTTIKKQLWRQIVVDKIMKQSEVADALGYAETAQKLSSLAKEVKTADNSNREAVASRTYFKEIFEDDFARKRESEINDCLNFGYSIILSKIAREIVSHGYSTIFGIFHDSSANQWNLGCDFIEPFRPLIDYVILTTDKPQLNKEMKAKLIGMLEKPVLYKEAERKLSTVIEMMIRDYLDVLERKKELTELSIYELPCLKE